MLRSLAADGIAGYVKWSGSNEGEAAPKAPLNLRCLPQLKWRFVASPKMLIFGHI